MNMEDSLNYLSALLKDKPWFYDLKAFDPRRIVVYTTYQSGDILREIPDEVGGRQVLVHFAPRSKPSTSTVLSSLPSKTSEYIESIPPSELNINELVDELDKIEKMCGSRTLQDIFYEIHDGKNAVTDMSKRYPEVRSRLEKLFDVYGFDVIYEEIDG